MVKDEPPYARSELHQIGDTWPERGSLCSTCGKRIPRFQDLHDDAEKRVLALIEKSNNIEAMQELRAVTGCSLRWAKLWVAHKGVPNGEVRPTAPCPFCGRPLRTSRAKQCRFCRRDWHRSNAKVLFRVPNEDGSEEVETLWATHIGGDTYKLDNSPFYAYGVSWADVVFAPSDSEGQPTFGRVVSKSGNRTVRVVFETPVDTENQSDQLLQGLVALGCSYEGANRKYVSVNIPPEVELQVVRNYLIKYEATWEHADPTHVALFPKDA